MRVTGEASEMLCCVFSAWPHVTVIPGALISKDARMTQVFSQEISRAGM